MLSESYVEIKDEKTETVQIPESGEYDEDGDEDRDRERYQSGKLLDPNDEPYVPPSEEWIPAEDCVSHPKMPIFRPPMPVFTVPKPAGISNSEKEKIEIAEVQKVEIPTTVEITDIETKQKKVSFKSKNVLIYLLILVPLFFLILFILSLYLTEKSLSSFQKSF